MVIKELEKVMKATNDEFLQEMFQADWLRPLGKGHKLEIGTKYIDRNNNSHNTQDFYGIDLLTNDEFRHTTRVLAAYADYIYNHEKWSARAGLRYEHSYMQGEMVVQQGNPNLVSSRTQRISLIYSYILPHLTLQIAPAYNFSSGGISSIQQILDIRGRDRQWRLSRLSEVVESVPQVPHLTHRLLYFAFTIS